MVEASIECYTIFTNQRLTHFEKDQLVREYSTVAALFGVKPKDRWNDYAAFNAYFSEMMSTLHYSSFEAYNKAMKEWHGEDFQADPRMFLELTEENRQLVLRQTLHPDNALAEIFQSQWALFVTGILPQNLREIYKLPWTAREVASFGRLVKLGQASMVKARWTEIGSRVWTAGAIFAPCAWWTIPCALAAGNLAGQMMHGPILYRRK